MADIFCNFGNDRTKLRMYYNLGSGYYDHKLKESQWQRGKELFDRGDYAAAVTLFRRAATDCYQMAECYLGYCHSHGLGVERNLFDALHWYRRNEIYVSWVAKDVAAIRAEIVQYGLVEKRDPVEFADAEFGVIRVTFSTKVNYPQVRFNAGYTAVTLHTSEPYDYAVAAICKALVNTDWRRQEHDYGRIDESFKLDYPLFHLRIERGVTDKYSFRSEGDTYTIITPKNVNFDLPCTREYIISYGAKLQTKAAEKYLPQRVEEISKQTGLYYSRCEVCSTGKNLGIYYPSGKVCLTPKLIRCSAEYVDVVILHELVHSLCGDHDQKFYDTMRHYGGERAVAVDKEYIGCNCDGDL